VTRVAMDDKSDLKNEKHPQPYAPSWVDRLTVWVDRLPGSSWLYYLGIGTLLFLLQIAILWSESAYPIGTLSPSYGFIAGIIPLFLGLLQYLDDKAGAALSVLRPALEASEREYSELHYRLTTLPVRPTLLASLASVIATGLITLFLGEPSSFRALGDSPISLALMLCMSIGVWWLFGAFLYHTIHQLRVINRIYTAYTRISLFQIGPLYAFSSTTALTAVSLTLSIYSWYALNPETLHDPFSLGVAFLVTALALATFIWPLLGVHRLLAAEKVRLLDETALHFEAAIAKLHQGLNDGSLERIDEINKAFAGLEMEQRAISRIPTWPWQPETVRWLVTALVLPLALWIIQYVLQLVLNP
jgi:hypothetical protein